MFIGSVTCYDPPYASVGWLDGRLVGRFVGLSFRDFLKGREVTFYAPIVALVNSS